MGPWVHGSIGKLDFQASLNDNGKPTDSLLTGGTQCSISTMAEESNSEYDLKPQGPDRGNAPNIRVGTSGFSYVEWRGIFYPEDLPQKKYLSYYAAHFNTTEINNTFYRIPTPKLAEGWRAEVPDSFLFTLKLSQKITHVKRLRNVEEEMSLFFSAAAELKEKLGPVLVQLPPNFKKNTEVFADFLARYAPGRMLAFEFRNESWFDPEVYDLLRKHAAALGVVEPEESKQLPTVREVTGPFVYMRLRKGEYSDSELADWTSWMKAQTVNVFCYMKHDEQAPVLALRMLEALGRSGS
ncbi:MAG TPA: DUF72 domain-containing protein [Blastocatellia bacterium]|nr:DUF72 domain-containing protein [Blastocatellia bacterium]